MSIGTEHLPALRHAVSEAQRSEQSEALRAFDIELCRHYAMTGGQDGARLALESYARRRAEKPGDTSIIAELAPLIDRAKAAGLDLDPLSHASDRKGCVMAADDSQAERCTRCQRPAPPVESFAFLEWEAADEEGNIICPGCLTGGEQRAIDEDAMEMVEALSACARCGKPSPEPGSSESNKWEVVADGLYVCNECLTAEDYLTLAEEADAAGVSDVIAEADRRALEAESD